MMRRHLATLLLILPLLAVAESEGPGPIEVPDIRANIIKMLQQKGERPATTAVPLSETTIQEAPVAEDLFEQAKRQMQQPAQRDNSPPAAPNVPAPESPRAPTAPTVNKESTQGYVPLPSKQITIEGLDDIKKLRREIDEAKKRQRQQ